MVDEAIERDALERLRPVPGSRGEQIYRAFKSFHRSNPVVWTLFQRFTREVMVAGHKRYSADAVVHRIRWHTSVETRGDEFRINDHFPSYYARLFMVLFPEYTDFFETRVRTSERRDAYAVEISTKPSEKTRSDRWRLVPEKE